MSDKGLLAHLFGGLTRTAPQRDGESAALEAHATGISPAWLDAAALPQRDGGAAGRRTRPLALPNKVVLETLSQKVLHGWLQNRHQTLYPLTINLRLLDTASRSALVRMMAAVLLAGTRMPDEARIASCLAWLREVGGEDELEQTLRGAIDSPEPMSTLLRDLQQAGMATYAYVVALVSAELHDDAAQRFLDYLGARLGLPATVIRSADRRYGHGAARASSVTSNSAV
ncbi:MAG: hypothetical protein ACJ8F3_14965 [Xanthobacteraceae bacterium]